MSDPIAIDDAVKVPLPKAEPGKSAGPFPPPAPPKPPGGGVKGLLKAAAEAVGVAPTRRNAAIVASAAFSLVAGVAAVKLMWPTGTQQSPRTTEPLTAQAASSPAAAPPNNTPTPTPTPPADQDTANRTPQPQPDALGRDALGGQGNKPDAPAPAVPPRPALNPAIAVGPESPAAAPVPPTRPGEVPNVPLPNFPPDPGSRPVAPDAPKGPSVPLSSPRTGDLPPPSISLEPSAGPAPSVAPPRVTPDPNGPAAPADEPRFTAPAGTANRGSRPNPIADPDPLTPRSPTTRPNPGGDLAPPSVLPGPTGVVPAVGPGDSGASGRVMPAGGLPPGPKSPAGPSSAAPPVTPDTGGPPVPDPKLDIPSAPATTLPLPAVPGVGPSGPAVPAVPAPMMDLTPKSPSAAPPAALPAIPGTTPQPELPVIPTNPGTNPITAPPIGPAPPGGTPPPPIPGSPPGGAVAAPPVSPPTSVGTVPPPAAPPTGGNTVPPPAAPPTQLTITKPANDSLPGPAPFPATPTARPGNTEVKPAGASERPPQTSFDVDMYEARAGDTYETIAREFYNDTRYARALQEYNGRRPVQPGRTVDVPPIGVLRQRHSGAIGGPPAGRSDPRSNPTPPAGEWSTAGTPKAADPDPTFRPAAAGGSQTFRVPPGGMSLKAVARQVLGTEQRWNELYDLNPRVGDPNAVPGGTTLKLPADARPPQ